jgi:serine/threonine protein kinase
MDSADAGKQPEQQVGRYAIYDEIAAGGMATVHLARLAGPEGFSRVVAAKRMHRHFLQDAEFKRMFLVEARLAARIRHPNVVPILDVIANRGEVIIVLEYVHGESLAELLRMAWADHTTIPLPVACSIMVHVLQGLHAAHEARSEQGEPLGIVHRDVSPHNVMVGADGVARVLDFGVAKAVQARQDTRPGVLKGKCSYMAPEVIRGEPITRQADVFSAATMFWEMLAGQKLFGGATEEERLLGILRGKYPTLRESASGVPPEVERIVMQGLQPEPSERHLTALEMAVEIETQPALASQRVVGEWVSRLAAASLARRTDLLQRIEVSTLGVIRPSWTDQLASSNQAATVPPPSLAKSDPSSLAQARVAPGRRGRSGWVAAIALVVIASVASLAWLRRSAVSATAGPATPNLSATLRAPAVPAPSGTQVMVPHSASPSGTAAPATSDVEGQPKTPLTRRPSAGPPKRSSHGKDFLPDEL